MSESRITTSPQEILRRYFGYDEFRPGQEEIINSIFSGGDTLVVMPTGGGKSLCYQIPGLMLRGITIVVSPLIALMKDQVDALNQRNVGATTINSTIDFAEVRQRLTDLRYGKYKLLYVAPERFESVRFLEMMKDINVSLFAVDEAHCISEWGHDFRPSYLRLNEAIEAIGRPPVIALTATATPFVQEDIVAQLGLRHLRRFVRGFDRPNLSWEVRTPRDKGEELRQLIKEDMANDGVSIVYCGTRRNVEDAGTALHAEGLPVTIYHAGLADGDRQGAQEAFIAGKARVIVATNAFGMGIDKANVRGVYHMDMPGSIEAYYQEGGRAGRDGKPSRCVMLWSGRDRGLQEFFIRNSFPERETLEGVYNALWDSVQVGIGSRHEGILVPNEKRIAARARIHPASIYGAISLLEKSGVIEQVRSDRLAVVRFTGSSEEIKRFYNVTRDEIRKKTVMGLLRTIGGGALGREMMFNPDDVAEKSDLSRADFERGMKGLTMARLLIYTPPTSRGGIRFLAERLPSRNLLIDEKRIEKERSRAVARLDATERYARTVTCRRDFILEYFGAEQEPEPCGRCDNCRAGKGRTTGEGNGVGNINGVGRDMMHHVPTHHVQPPSPPHEERFRENILVGIAALGERFGKMTVIDFLLGNSTKTINMFGLDNHSRFGILKGEERIALARIADRLLGEGLIRSTADTRPLIKLTDAGREQISHIHVEPFIPSPAETERTSHPDLLKRLKTERDSIADRDGFTQNEVSPDIVLVRISNRVPADRSELLRTKGFTQGHFDICGTSLLQVLEEYRSELEGSDEAFALPIRLRHTFELINQGYDLDEIARQTARQPSTISGHIEELIKLKALEDVERFVPRGIVKNVAEVLADRPSATLRELRALTGGGIGYPELRIAAAWVRNEK
ncbi:MAG: RecQ family ATP-dependent DNA helicase [Ignavibacteriae bacterium]|nr:RecQ family ATP-dependent DNA helicase [Ignavibacteriota bacterium]